MVGNEGVDFGDVRGDGGALLADFFELSVEIIGLGAAIKADKGVEFALIIDKIVRKSGFIGRKLVLVFDKLGGGKAVFD